MIGDRGSGAGPALQPSGSAETLLRLTGALRKEIRKEEREREREGFSHYVPKMKVSLGLSGRA